MKHSEEHEHVHGSFSLFLLLISLGTRVLRWGLRHMAKDGWAIAWDLGVLRCFVNVCPTLWWCFLCFEVSVTFKAKDFCLSKNWCILSRFMELNLRALEISTCCWGWWRYQILAVFKNVFYQRRCGTTILPSFHSTAHGKAVLKAGGSKCLRMPNMASQNPENSVGGETRCWTILIYPYLILFISSMLLHELFWALFSNKRSTRTSTPVSSPPKTTPTELCQMLCIDGESPHEQMFLRKPMRKLLCGAVSNFKTFKSGRRWGQERYMQLVPCTYNKLYGIVQ